MFFLIFLLASLSRGGKITPDSKQPVELYWNNQDYSSDYIFSMSVSSPIPSDGFLTIDFPSQYASGLGIVSCESWETTSKDLRVLPCSVSARTLQLTFGEVLGGVTSVRIKGITNPSQAGSTGFFQVRTWRASTIIDENTHFASLGIAPAPGVASVALSTQGSLEASYSPIFVFAITFSKLYREGTWIRLLFPSVFGIDSPTCYMTKVFECYKFEDSLHIPMDILLEADTYELLIYDVVSPPSTEPIDDITVEVLEEGTYTVLESNSVLSPTVLPGTVSKIEIVGDPLVMHSPSTYTISFRPANYIPEGGSIQVEFPSEFQELESCYLVSGLLPVGDSIVSCSVSSLTVTLTGFQAVESSYIEIQVKAVNPSVAGQTSQFQIYTYTDTSYGIDSEENAGSVTISTIQYPQDFSITMITPKEDNELDHYGPIDLFLHPRTSLPCDSSDFFDIELVLPSSMEKQSGEIVCMFDETPATVCNFNSPSTIQIRTPIPYMCCPFSIKIDTDGELPRGFRILSSSHGKQTFLVRVFYQGVQVEEAEYIFSSKPLIQNNFELEYLHHTRGAWNVLKFSITNSLEIPVDGMIEFEFQTWNHSFPFDLGWDLKSFEHHSFACTFDPSFPGTPSCMIIAGTTIMPAFVQFSGFSAPVTPGTTRWLWLYGVLNGEYANFIPKLAVRTKDAEGTVLEENEFELPVLQELPSPSPNFVYTVGSLNQDEPAIDTTFRLLINEDLAEDGQIYIAYPRGYKWDTPNYQGEFTAPCSPFHGLEENYREFTHPQSAGILYLQPTGEVISSFFETCVTIDHQSLWFQDPLIKAYIVKDGLVRDYYEIQNGQILTTPDITLEGLMDNTSLYDIQSRNLWKLRFNTQARITWAGSVQVHFPREYWDSVDDLCYKVHTADVTCEGETNYSDSYHRVLFNGFVPQPELPGGLVLEAWFYATTGDQAGVATILVFSQDEDNKTDKIIEYKEFDIQIDQYTTPLYSAVDYHLSNFVEAYHSTPSTTEWGPVKLLVTPSQTFPEATTLYKTLVTISFPWDATDKYFPKNPDGLIECRVRRRYGLEEKRYLGRHCSWTEGFPDVVQFYLPKEVRLEAGEVFEIELQTAGAPIPSENGFAYPDEPGDYRFIVHMDKNDGALIHQSETFVYAKESRFTNVRVTSENKVMGQPNMMNFNFMPTTKIPASDNPTQPGRVFIEFPVDTGDGRGFEHDLGTGIANEGKIDCHQENGNTVLAIVGDELDCRLIHGYVDYVRIEVSNFQEVNAGTSTFNLYFGGLYNVVRPLFDYWIRIRSVYQDLADLQYPEWVTIDTITERYVETTHSYTPLELGNLAQEQYHSTNAESRYNRVSDPVRFVPGVDLLEVSFNIHNADPFSVSDEVLLKIPSHFKLPEKFTDFERVTIVSGSQGGESDSSCLVTEGEVWRESSSYLKVTLCMAINLRIFIPQSPGRDPDTPNRVTLYPLEWEEWPTSPISNTESWVLRARKTESYNFDYFFAEYLIPVGVCEVLFAGTKGDGVFGATEKYNFRFICENEVPAVGEYIIFFPREFTEGTVLASPCEFSDDTDPALETATCSLVRDIEVHISEFSVIVPPSGLVDVSFDVQNPTQGTLDNPYYGDRFTIASYDSIELDPGTFSIIDLGDPAGYAWLSDSANPAFQPPVLEQDDSLIIYLEQLSLVNPGTTPLVFEYSSSQAIIKEVGYVLIRTTDNVDIPPGAELRCVWSFGGVELLADKCEGTIGITSEIEVYAPKYDDVPANQSVAVKITTLYAEGRFEGLRFRGGLIEYSFEFELYPSGGALLYKELRYTTPVASPFPYLEIDAGCWTKNEFTRIILSFSLSTTAIPSTAWLVFEIDGVYAQDLGLGLSNNDSINCQSADDLTDPVSCYLRLGASDAPIQIVITDFPDLNDPSKTYSVHFPYVINPSAGGDDFHIHATVYAVDITVYPPLYLYYRRVPYAWKIRTNVPEVLTGLPEPTVSDNTNSAKATYTFAIGSELQKDDNVVIVLPSQLSMDSATPTCTDDGSVTHPCTYYSSTNTVIVEVLSDFSRLNILEVNNPDIALSEFELFNIVGYIWSDNALVERLEYTEMTETFGTLQSTVEIFFPGKPSSELLLEDILEYLIIFTNSKSVPSGGSVAFDFAVEFPVIPTTVCTNVPLVSEVPDLKCEITGNSILVTEFEEIPANSKLAISVLVQNPGVAGSFALTISSYNAPSVLIESTELTLTILNLKAPTFYNFPRQHHYARLAVSSEYAVLQFRLINFGSFTKEVGKIMVTLDLKFGDVPDSADIVCLWGDKRSKCELNSDLLTSYAPEDADWTDSDYVLTVTSTNARIIDDVGVQIPPTRGEYQFLVQSDNDGDSTIDVEAMDYLSILPSTYLKNTEVSVGHRTALAKNLLKINTEPSQVIPTGGYIRLYFPILDKWGNTVFTPDLGTGVSHGDLMQCQSDLTPRFGDNIHCRLYHGQSYIGKPSFIEITNFEAVSTALEIVLWGIINPATVEIVHAHMWIVTLDDEYIELDTYEINHLFSVAPEIPFPPTSPAFPYNTPQITIGSVGTQIEITIYLVDNLQAITDDTVYILEMPPEIPLAGINVLGAVANVYEHLGLIEIVDPPAGALGSFPELKLQTALTLDSNLEGKIITSYQWDNGFAVVNAWDYEPFEAEGLGEFKDIVLDIPQHQKRIRRTTLTFELTAKIPENGSIKVTLPPDYGLVADDCELAGLLEFSNFKCTITGQSLHVEVYEEVPSSTVLTITFYVLVTSDGTDFILLESFSDLLATEKLERAEVERPEAPTRWPTTLIAPTQSQSFSVSIEGDLVQIVFKIFHSFSIAYSASQFVEVTLDTPFVSLNGELFCTVDDYLVYCEEVTANQVYKIYASSDKNIVSGSEIKLYAHKGNSDLNGFEQPASGENNLTVLATDGVNTEFETVKVVIPKQIIPTFIVRPLHFSQDTENVFEVLIIPSNVVDGAAGDYIDLEFPLEDYAGHSLFREDLGSSKASGETFYCDNFRDINDATISNISCTLFKGILFSSSPAKIRLSGTFLIGSSGVRFEMSKLKNPQTMGSDVHVSVYARVYSSEIEIARADYLLKVETTHGSCLSVPSPDLSSYVTDESAILFFRCYASENLTAGDYYIIEYPEIYPTLPELILTGPLDIIEFRLPSSRWLVLGTSSDAYCLTLNPYIYLFYNPNPSYEVPANTIALSGYAVKEGVVIDCLDFAPIPQAITSNAVPKTCVVSGLTLTEQTDYEGLMNIFTFSFACDVDIEVNDIIEISITTDSTIDPYYFTGRSGIGDFNYEFDGSKYTVTSLSTVALSTPMEFDIGVVNPLATKVVTFGIDALSGTGSIGSSQRVKPFAFTAPLQSHRYRILTIAADFSIEIDTFTPSLDTNHNQVYINFSCLDGSIAASTDFTANVSFDGNPCTGDCNSATWIDSSTLVIVFTADVYNSEYHVFTIDGLTFASPAHLCLVTIRYAKSSNVESNDIFYSFAMYPSSEDSTTTWDHIGVNAGMTGTLSANFVRNAPVGNTDLVLIEFLGDVHDPQNGWTTSLADGSTFSGATSSTSQVNDCTLRVSTTSLRFGVVCRCDPGTGPLDVLLFDVENPSNEVTVYYNLVSISRDPAGHSFNGMGLGSSNIAVGTAPISLGSVTMSDSLVQTSSIWDLSAMINPLLVAGDFVFIKFYDPISVHDYDSFANSNGIDTILSVPSFGYTFLKLTDPAVELSLNNPFEAGTYTIEVSSYSAGLLTTIIGAINIEIVSGLHTSLSFSYLIPPEVGSETSITAEIELSYKVPVNGSISLFFLSSHIGSIDCTACTSSLSDESASVSVSYTVTGLELQVTGFSEIPVSTITINEIRGIYVASGTTTVVCTTYGENDGDIASVLGGFTITGSASASSGIVKLPYYTFFKGFRTLLNSQPTVLTFYFQPGIQVTDSDRIEVESDEWTINPTNYLGTDNFEVFLINGNVASCETIGNVRSITPHADLNPTEIYKFEHYTRYNDFQVQSPDTDGEYTVKVRTMLGGSAFEEGEFTVPITPVYSEASAWAYAQGSGQESLLEVSVKVSTNIVGEYVVFEFPLIDIMTLETLFETSIGTTDGTTYPCESFVGLTGLQRPRNNIYCAIVYGYTVSQYTTQSTQIIVYMANNIIPAEGLVVIGFPGLKIPTSSFGPDLRIYTLDLAGGVKEQITIQKVINTHPVTTVNTSFQNFQTNYSNVVIDASPVSFDLSITPSEPLSASDILIFIYNVDKITIDVDSTNINGLGYTSLHIYPRFGWIALKLLSSVSGVQTVTLTGFTNPGYILDFQDYVIEARHFKYFEEVLSPSVWERTYRFDLNGSTDIFEVGEISVAALGAFFGCLQCLGTSTSVYSDQSVMYKLGFVYNLQRIGGSFTVKFPDEFTELAETCEVISDGFSDTSDVKCENTDGHTLIIYNFGTYTENSEIIVYVRAKNPEIAYASTGKFEFSAFYNVDGTINIGFDDTNSLEVTGPSTPYIGTSVIDIIRTSDLISARELQENPLVFEFELTSILAKDTGSIQVQVPTGTFSPTSPFYCVFIDSQSYEYGSKDCTYDSDLFTIVAPIETDILPGERWKVKIHSKTGLGLPYPLTNWHAFQVLFPAEQFEFNYLVLPVAINEFRVLHYCETTGFKNSFDIILLADIESYEDNVRIEIEFPSIFNEDLGTGSDDLVDCNTDMDLVSALNCSLIKGEYLDIPYRPILPTVRVHNQDENIAVERKLQLSYIENPVAINQHVEIRLRIYKIVSMTEVAVNDEVIYYTFYTYDTPFSATGGDSYLNSMLPDLQIGRSGVTFSVNAFLGAFFLKSSDFLFWRFPYPIGPDIVIENSGSTQDIDLEILSTFRTTGLIVSSPPTGDTYSSTIQFDFSDFVNPSAVPLSPPVLSLDVVIDKRHILTISYQFNLLNHTPGDISVDSIQAGSVANDGYLNGFIDLYIKFSASGSLDYPVVKIAFPGFSFMTYCDVILSTLPVVKGARVDCSTSGQEIFISNILSYPGTETIELRVWAYLPSTTGPHSVSFQMYDDPLSISFEGTGTYTVNNQQGFPSLSFSYILQMSDDNPSYVNEVAPLLVPIELPENILKKEGFVTVNFENPSFTVTKPRCIWSNGSVNWQADKCELPEDTTSISVKAYAPEENDLTAGIWTLMIRSMGNTDKDGLTNPDSSKMHTIFYRYSADGVLDEVLISTQEIKVARDSFAASYLQTYNERKQNPILFEAWLTPASDYGSGVPLVGGTSYIILKFPTTIDAVAYFTDDLGTSYQDAENYPCFSLLSMNNLQCYIVLGDAINSKEAVVYIYSYDDEFSANQHRFYLPWLYNPSDAKVNFRVTIEVWNSEELQVYKEFKYVYDVLDESPNTRTISLAYANSDYGGIGDVTFLFNLSEGLDLLPDEKIVWKLLEEKPDWSGYICTPPGDQHTCDILHSDHIIVTHIGSVIGQTESVVLENVPNPIDPSASQSWEIYVFKGGVLQDVMTARKNKFPYADAIDFFAVEWKKPDGNVPNPLVNRFDEYTFRFMSSESLLEGNRLLLYFPGDYGLTSHCNVRSGLSGTNLICAYSEDFGYIECRGFEDYYPYYPAVEIVCHAFNPGSAGITTDFTMDIYDNTGSFVTVVAPGFTIENAPEQFTDLREGIPERTRVNACEDVRYTDLWLKIIPRYSVYYPQTMSIWIPTGVSFAGGDPHCMWHTYGNSTPSRHTCIISGNTITSEITEQLNMIANQEYTLHVYSRDAPDGLGKSGFLLPSTPSMISWYFRARDPLYITGNAEKIAVEVCPVEFTDLSLKFHSLTIQRWGLLDLTFTPSRDVSADGGIAIEMPTYNEIDDIFPEDLGLGLKPLESEKEIACIPITGFGNPAPGTVKCKIQRAYTIGTDTPALIKVYGASLSSIESHTIRVVKFMNPVKVKSEILNEEFAVHFHIWTYGETTNDFATDEVKLNMQTLLRVIDPETTNNLREANPVLYNEPAPTTAIDKIWTVITDPLSTSINLGVEVDKDSGFIIYEFDPGFILPTSDSPDILCNGLSTDCSIYAEASWVIWRIDQTPINPLVLEFEDAGASTFRTPSFEQAGYSFSVYVVDELEWKEEHYLADLTIFSRGALTVDITHRLTTLHRSTYDIWKFTITPEKSSPEVKRIDIHFPSQFQWLDIECQSSLEKTDLNVNPVSCVSDCNNEVCTNHIIITNFLDASNTITVEIGAMNPENEGETDDFTIFYYSDLEDTSKIVEDYQGGKVTIDSIIYPNDFWIELPTASIYDRKVKDSSYGEIWLRFRPRIDLPPVTGMYRLVIPEEFDIVPLADLVCTIVHTDIPFDNFPDWHSRDYHHVRATKCSYSYRTIDLHLPDSILREFYGVDSDICTYLIFTTEESVASDERGFRASLVPGCYGFEFYAMIGSSIIESAFPQICISGGQLEDLVIDNNTVDTDANAIYRIAFSYENDIPPGVFYWEGSFPGTRSTIELEFSVFESFDTDLDENDNDVYCQSIKGIVGDDLKCTLSYGSVSYSPFVHTPAKIQVTNFEKITRNTEIELHIPILNNPGTDGWVPEVSLGIFTEDASSTVVWIVEKTTAVLEPVSPSIILPLVTGMSIEVTNTELKSSTTLTLSFEAQSQELEENSMILIEFPEQYTNIPLQGISVYIVKDGIVDPSTETYIITDIEVITYPEPRIVSLTIPAGKSIKLNEDVKIHLFNFVNPDHIASGEIYYYSINPSKKIIDQYTTSDIFTIVSFTASSFDLQPISMSSLYANSGGVTSTFEFSPNVDIDSSMTTTISFPSDFPDISTLTPTPTCSVSIGTCQIVGNTVVISGVDIPKDTQVTLTIDGISTPVTSTEIQQGSDGFVIESVDSNGNSILYAEFPSLKIYGETPVTLIQMAISPTFTNAAVISDYNFTISTMKGVQAGTVVKLVFPIEFANLANNRCFVSGAITSFRSCNIVGREIEMEVNEGAERYSTFTISIPFVMNPLIEGPTSAFLISTEFSGVTTDQSDPDDPAAVITIKPTPSYLSVTSHEIFPTNEGEASVYSFVIENFEEISGDISVVFRYPYDYSFDLIRSDMELYCFSEPSHLDCFTDFAKLVHFYELSPVEKAAEMKFDIYGVNNPQSGTTSDTLKVYYYSNSDENVIAYSDFISFDIGPLPSMLNMTSVSSSTDITHTSADYVFEMGIDTIGFDEDGGILIDWPVEYAYLFHQTTYDCEIVHYTSCIMTEGFRQTTASDAVPVAANYGDLSIKLLDAPTPQIGGETGSFTLKLFDQNSITARSYPNLTPKSTLEFRDIGYKIFTNATDIEIYPGAYSDPILIRLEEPTFEMLMLEPIEITSNLRFEPPTLNFQYVQTSENVFRVYAPAGTPPGIYQVTWEKSENVEETDREYKHMPDFFVTVKEPEAELAVFCEDISYIPIGGTSLPIKISLEKPAYSKLVVTVTSSQTDDVLIISPSNVIFALGQQENYFTISLSYGAISDSVQLSLSDEASGIYYLVEESKHFQTVAPSSISPEIKSIRLTTIERNSATLMVQVTDISTLNYMYTKKGSNPPIKTMLNAHENSWSDTFCEYGSVFTNVQNGIAHIELTGLTDDTEYTIFIDAVNRAHHSSISVTEFDFRTLSKCLPVKFRVYVTETSSSEQVRLAVAKALAVEDSYVIDIGLEPDSNGNEELFYEFVLFNSRTDSSYKPIDLLTGLKEERLEKYVPFYSSSHEITEFASEFSHLMPEFSESFEIATSMEGTVSVDIGLQRAGCIYAIILGANKKEPMSQQIRDGLDGHNILVKDMRFDWQNLMHGEVAKLEFQGLVVHEEMVVYLTAENDLPGNPDLMNDEYVLKLPIVVGTELDNPFTFKFEYYTSALLLVCQLIVLTLV